MPARQKSCCFTGHRPAKLPWGYREEDPRCITLKARIFDAVTLAWQEGYRHFICGMAQGCDLYFCCLLYTSSKCTDKRAQKGKRVKYPMVFSGAEGHRYGSGTAQFWEEACLC